MDDYSVLYYFHFSTQTYHFFFDKDENWFPAITDVAILKTQIIHMIEISTSEDMENISLCILYCLLHSILGPIYAQISKLSNL